MEIVNELEVRKMLKEGLSVDEVTTSVIKHILDESLSWSDKRPFWHFLLLSGRQATLAHALSQCLKAKLRVPFDLIIEICTRARLKPTSVAVLSLLKGVRKQHAADELIGATGWDKYDNRFATYRQDRLAAKAAHEKAYREGLLEKFEFLQSQRMTEQAAKLLERMVKLYPENSQFIRLKIDFEEQWAREILADHAASVHSDRIDYTQTAPSAADEEMLECFFNEGEALSLDNREIAAEFAIIFFFLEDYHRALKILAWAPPSLANDWLKAELLFQSRRFIEAMELANQLELKYIEDPETTFAANYLRAQCLKESGQVSAALEILRSIVHVRPNYRSVNALLQEWTEGANWG